MVNSSAAILVGSMEGLMERIEEMKEVLGCYVSVPRRERP
jgi:hypothetical protein